MNPLVLCVVADLRRCVRAYRAGTDSVADFRLYMRNTLDRADVLGVLAEVIEAYRTLPADATAALEAERDAEDAEDAERAEDEPAPDTDRDDVREPSEDWIDDCDVREPMHADDLRAIRGAS